MKETRKINELDHIQMIRDFETSSRHEDHLKKIRKKWASESKKYQQTIQHMKEVREETYLKKKEDLLKRLDQKEQLLLTSLETKEKDKLKEKQKAIALMMQRERAARKNVKKYLEEQEKNRLLFERQTHEKSKHKLYLIHN